MKNIVVVASVATSALVFSCQPSLAVYCGDYLSVSPCWPEDVPEATLAVPATLWLVGAGIIHLIWRKKK